MPWTIFFWTDTPMTRVGNRSYRSIPRPDRSIYIDHLLQSIDIDRSQPGTESIDDQIDRSELQIDRYRSIRSLDRYDRNRNRSINRIDQIDQSIDFQPCL